VCVRLHYLPTQDNILKSYEMRTDVPSQMAKLAICFLIMYVQRVGRKRECARFSEPTDAADSVHRFSYPVLGFSARTTLDQLLFPRKQPPTLSRIIGLATPLVALTLVLAAVVPGISFVFAVFGATIGNVLVLVLPGYWCLSFRMRKDLQLQEGLRRRPQTTGDWVRLSFRCAYWPMLMAIGAGLLFILLSSTSILIDVI
jgi:hypothetical protein